MISISQYAIYPFSLCEGLISLWAHCNRWWNGGAPRGDAALVLKNCWYVACFADEVEVDSPLARTLCGKAMLFYRDADGTLVALHDACPHRSAPLSLGMFGGGTVTCRYHGLSFGKGGACIANPHAHR